LPGTEADSNPIKLLKMDPSREPLQVSRHQWVSLLCYPSTHISGVPFSSTFRFLKTMTTMTIESFRCLCTQWGKGCIRCFLCVWETCFQGN
jgi:hypothetical protein